MKSARMTSHTDVSAGGPYQRRYWTGGPAVAPPSPWQGEGWGERAGCRRFFPLTRTLSPSGGEGNQGGGLWPPWRCPYVGPARGLLPCTVFGDCVLDTERYVLHRAGQPIRLRPKVFQVLVYLLSQRERVVTKQELSEQVWNGQAISDATLESTLSAVRRALGDQGRADRYIHTRHGYGYRFVAPVEERADPLPDAASAASLAVVEAPRALQRAAPPPAADAAPPAVMGDRTPPASHTDRAPWWRPPQPLRRA
jgi:DNA-binding winged helix-turn-helix (wHTH) protein